MIDLIVCSNIKKVWQFGQATKLEIIQAVGQKTKVAIWIELDRLKYTKPQKLISFRQIESTNIDCGWYNAAGEEYKV